MSGPGFNLNLSPMEMTIAKERSINLVVLKPGWSQPEVSICLKKLRESFGDPLFVRSAHGIEPTPRVKAVLTLTRSISASGHSPRTAGLRVHAA
jgi:DNA-binding transcriptional LysR family regulator